MEGTLSRRWGNERVTSIAKSGLPPLSGEVAAHVAEGNLIVFEEMAPLYAAWVCRFSGARRKDRAALGSFLSELSPGPVERGGQDMLIEAFTHYHDAMFERDAKARAELILLANLLVGYHEQTRLQGVILRAMNAPLRALPILRGVERRCEAGPGARPPSPLLSRLSRGIERRWRELLTGAFMTLELPGLRLDLGEDLPPWSARHDFPTELMTATHPRLVALLGRLDLTPDTVAGSGARDWASLRDRMNFVVDFFRTRQQDQSLYQEPFPCRRGGIPRRAGSVRRPTIIAM